MYRRVFDLSATLNRIVITLVIKKKLRVESRQTRLTACATNLMFALDYASHPDGSLTNIVPGQIAHSDVNAANAVSLGHLAMENVKGGWPDSVYCPLGKLDVSMDVMKNHMLVGRNVSMTRNSSRHLSLVYLQDHEISTSMMCWPLSYLHIHHWCSMKMEKWMSPRPSRHKNTNHKWLYLSVIAQSQTLGYMMCLHFSGLSPGRPANCVSTWTP